MAIKNKGWTVAFAGIGINLALGILYAWSIFKSEITNSIDSGGDFAWDPAAVNDPYAVCCIVFAFAMILAGKCQDKLGPKVTAMIGGVLVGIGFIWISRSTAYISWVIGFGVLAGTGIGFGYSSATPPALKWFPPKKTGLIAGLVVSGFGLASVYIAPLAKYLLNAWGMQNAMLFFGIAFLIVVCGLSLLLVNPPPGYVAVEKAKKVRMEDVINRESSFLSWFPESVPAWGTGSGPATQKDLAPSQMLKSLEFYLLWFIYLIGAGAGLMVIGSVAGMAKQSMGEAAFVAVAIMAVGNAGGRIVAGILSDKIGRSYTLMLMLGFQAALMFFSIFVVGSESTSPLLLVLLATFIGFNYGTNLSIFPSFAKDLWGLRNFGMNYGILFSAWGVGGFIMSRLSQMLKTQTGSFNSSFITAGVLLIAGIVLTIFLESRLSRR